MLALVSANAYVTSCLITVAPCPPNIVLIGDRKVIKINSEPRRRVWKNVAQRRGRPVSSGRLSGNRQTDRWSGDGQTDRHPRPLCRPEAPPPHNTSSHISLPISTQLRTDAKNNVRCIFLSFCKAGQKVQPSYNPSVLWTNNTGWSHTIVLH